MISKRINDKVIGIIREYSLEDQQIDSKYMFYMIIDKLNSKKNIIITISVTIIVILIIIVDMNNFTLLGTLSLDFWGSIVSTSISGFFIWYITKRSEQKKYLHQNISELLLDLYNIYENNQYMKSSIKILIEGFGGTTIYSKLSRNHEIIDALSTLEAERVELEYQLANFSKKYISLRFYSYNIPAKFAKEEIDNFMEYRNRLINTKVSLDEYLNSICSFDVQINKLEKLLRNSVA